MVVAVNEADKIMNAVGVSIGEYSREGRPVFPAFGDDVPHDADFGRRLSPKEGTGYSTCFKAVRLPAPSRLHQPPHRDQSSIRKGRVGSYSEPTPQSGPDPDADRGAYPRDPRRQHLWYPCPFGFVQPAGLHRIEYTS